MKGRLLVAYSGAATYVATTMEYLNSFSLYSKFDVSYLHVTHGAEIDVNLDEFDAVLNSYCARLCFSDHVSQSYIDALKAFKGVRLLAVQDEYNQTYRLHRAIRDIGFHVVFTCVPEESHEFVYPSKIFPNTEFITVLTGYVPAKLKDRGANYIPLAQRPTTIGYRGRKIGGVYGRLGFDKFEIGRRMREICEERGISQDIEMTEDKRIYGDAWYDFLGSCRAILGTESGSNVFDFDGNLERKYEELKAAKGGELSYEEFRSYTEPFENQIQMGQVSPRVFEAAATRTPMVLFSGRYSNVVSAGEHYIELAKDFSNVDEVLDKLNDFNFLNSLVERAYRHLVESGNYDYRRFVSKVDQIIDSKRSKAPARRVPRMSPYQADWSHQMPTSAWLMTTKERPTLAPREPIFFYYFFYYRALYLEHKGLEREFASETSRLIKEVKFLQAEFASETSRLMKEIEFLKAEFASETSRLSEAKLADENRLRRVLDKLANENNRLRRMLDEQTSTIEQPRRDDNSIFFRLVRAVTLRSVRASWRHRRSSRAALPAKGAE